MSPKTLVVPLDGSEWAERALPIADALADRIGGRLVLVSSQYYGPIDPTEYLEEMAARHKRNPVDIVTTKDTYAAEVIVEAVQASDDRVVCMTTHGRGSVRWAALGSVAEEVIRRAERPTILVGRHCRPDFLAGAPNLLAAADGSDNSAELATAARDWAGALGLDLRATVVVHPLDVESAEHSFDLMTPIAADFGLADRTKVTMVRSNYPAGAIADLAAELPAALIGLNCHGRTGLARFALGSVTMGVVHLASCPVLVTHREGRPANGTEGAGQ